MTEAEKISGEIQAETPTEETKKPQGFNGVEVITIRKVHI